MKKNYSNNQLATPSSFWYKKILLAIPFILVLFLNQWYLLATPPCQIVNQAFANSVDGATSDASSTGWSLSTVSGATYWACQSHRIKAQGLGAVGTWSSAVFNISGRPNVQVEVKVSSEGTLDAATEYVAIYYKLNGGALTLMQKFVGNFGTPDIFSVPLNGSTVQIVIQVFNKHNGLNSYYYIEKYGLNSQVVGCSLAVAPSVSGTITCTTPSVTLSPGANTTSNVTYSWTGPNGFTSTSQNPVVSTSGTYNVTASIAASSSTASGSVIVSQNTTAPGAIASENGTLTCLINSVSLSGSSSTSGVTYAWTGPSSFSSTLQNPSASTSGTYTLTVTNPVNGCKSTATTTVPQNITAPGATASVSGPLTCTALSVTLSGNSSTSGVSYSWSGSNGLKSTLQNPTVSTVGIDTVTVTNPANGCKSTANVTVTQNKTAPGATASVSGTLTCSTTSVTISGSSSTSGVTYNWVGPGSFTSSVQSPSVSTPGIYTLTVTNPTNGCTSTAAVTVTQNITAPGATAGETGTLTCTSTSASLSGGSSTSGVTYSWTGPNSFTSALQNPIVSASGTYTLTVKNPTNGCTSAVSATVPQNTTVPGATAGVSGTLTCATTSVTLSGSSGTTGVTYSWTGPNSFTSTSQNLSVNGAGVYTLIVTNPTNGCTSAATASVAQNINVPDVSATGASLPCSGSVTITGNSTVTGVTFGWTGPNGFTSTLQNPTVSETGVYTLSVTNPANGCTGSDTAIVIQGIAIPGVTATVTGPLTCTTNSVTLSGNAGISGVTYNWSGPGNFTSSVQNPVVSAPGTYTLTVSNPSNGCTSTVTVLVTQNLTTPGATTGVSGLLTCATTNINLSGSSSTSGVSYSWSGPNNFTSSLQNPSASAIGTYTLTVTNPVNGCTSTSQATVTQDKTSPGASASASGPLTCTNTSISLSGSSLTSGVAYSWSGPGNFTSTSANPTVSTIGTYTLTVTNPVNGCISSTAATVVQNLTTPGAAASETGTLTCTETSASLSGSSSTAGVTYSWAGPNSYSSAAQNPTVSISGTYTLTVKDPTNGCTSAASTVVPQNTIAPGASTGVNGALTCTTASVILSGTSGTSGVTYSWSGPNSFASTSQNPTVNAAGTYTLTVTNPVNGCISTSSAVATQNITVPGASATGGSLTCTRASLTLSGNSATSGVTYSWTGPNGFTSTLQNPIVNTIGNYALTVTNPANGCISASTTSVILDTVAPGATAGVSGPLGCANPTVTLSGNSGTSGVSYAWTGPSSFTSALQNPAVSNPGTYALITTNPNNGCTSISAVTVVQNSVAPGATAGGGGTITCATPSVTLSGSSVTPGVSYSWTGPSSFTSTSQNPTVTTGGTYTLVVTNPTNGCTSTSTIIVAQNTTAPGATASGGVLTCAATSVSLLGSSTTSGVAYSWSGPGSFTSAVQSPSVNTIGNYTLTVTNPVNGCTSTTTASITQNISAPGATAIGGSLTCTSTSVSLSGSSGTSGVTFSWTGPNNFVSNLQNPAVNTLGTYMLTVTDPVNGCSSIASASVTQNTSIPDIAASGGGTLTCTTTSVTLSGSSSTTGVTYNWSGPNGFTSTLQNPAVSVPGIYNLSITNPANNCTSTGMINVLQNTSKPGVKASSNGTITCGKTSVSLTATSATPNSSFAWGGFTAGVNPVNTSSAGKYFVTATNPVNGCTSIDSVVVSKVASSTSYQFVYNNFSAYANGVVSDNSTTNGWYLDNSGVPNISSTYSSNLTPYFAIHSHRVSAQQMGGQGIWYTQVMNVAAKPNFQIGVKITSEGTLNSDEYVKLYYKLDGGSEVLWAQQTGYFGTLDFRSPTLNANTIQIVVKLYNYGKGGSIVSNYYVEEEQLYIGGCGGTLLVYPAVSGNITCANPSATLSATSSHSGATFQWSGPNSFTSTQQYPVVSTAGTYNVTATIPPSSVTTGSVTVLQNTTVPGASASVNDTLTCAKTYVTLSGNSSTSGVTYSWTGPNGFVSSMQNPTVTAPGTYTLAVTNPANGCTSTVSVIVIQNTTTTGATATVSDTLTCSRASVTITGNFTTTGVTYSWTGPNGFTSNLQSTSVSLAGLYTLIVTNPVTGCTSTAYANVIQSSTAPNISVTGGALTCTITSIVLSGNSTTPGVTYSWSGPGNFSSSSKNPTVSSAGTYTLTVNNPANGCTSIGTATVTQNNTPLDVTANGGTITCVNSSVTLAGSSSSSGVTYNWTGPNGFTSSLQNPTVNTAGTYVLTVSNGSCTGTANAIVSQNITMPGATANGGKITCTAPSVTLTGSSGTSGVTYSWSGPSFVSTSQNPSTNTQGIYTLTVTNPTNGCVSTDTAMVSQNITLPVANGIGGGLTCSKTLVILTGSSATSGVTYSWTGPSFTSTAQNPTVAAAGTYTLTVTNPVNGCVSTDTAMVSQNITLPGANGIGGKLTCTKTSVMLTGSSSTSGVTYNWSGPSFTSTAQNPTVSGAGTYTLTVANPVNGCVSTDTAMVSQNITLPGANGIGGKLTCTKTSVMLTGSSSTSGVTYNWSGPSFTSTAQNPTVSSAGTYTVTVTNPANGCVSTDTAMVSQNITLPGANGIGGKLTCTKTSVTLTGSSSTSGVTYSWSGPSFSSSVQNPTVISAGTYTVTVTDPVNGCTSTDTAIVSQNIETYIATAIGGFITCTNSSITLSGNSSGSRNIYSWTGPGSFTSAVQNPIVTGAGIYTLAVTNQDNGCTSTDTAMVTLNNTKPGASAGVSTVLTCNATSVTLTGSSSTSGVTYSWSGPLNFASTEQNPVTTHDGAYTLTVTNPANGCTSTSSVPVLQDTTTASGVTTSVSGMLNCMVNNVTLAGSSSTSEATYSWTGPNSYSSNSQSIVVSTPGNYILHVSKPSNGCVITTNAVVVMDTIKPVVTITSSGIISCTASSVTLTGSSTPSGVSYAWSGPSFTATGAVANVTNPGTYSVTVTNPGNSCSTSTSVTVVKDLTQPAVANASASGELTCAIPSITLSAPSTTFGVAYSWAGPGTYTSNESTPHVSNPGTYIVTVTDPYNNCSITKSVDVSQDKTVPEGVIVSVSDILSCYNASVTLSGSSTTAGVTYSWTGPGGYTSDQQDPIVGVAGTYTLMVASSTNGCTTVMPVIVEQDTTPPADVLASVSGILNCRTTSVTLTGSSSTQGVDYEWDAPNGNFITSNPNVAVISPGTYTLIVTNSGNGCSKQKTATVVLDKALPVSSIIPPSGSPVALTNNTLSAQAVDNASYLWGFSSSNSNWSIVSGGASQVMTYQAGDAGTSATYSLTVTNNGNGCSKTSQIGLTAVSTLKSVPILSENVEDAGKTFVFKAYPNPFTDKATLEILPLVSSHMTAELHSGSGKLEGILFDSDVQSSQLYKITIDGEKMQAGTYYIIIRTNGQVYSQKIIFVN